VDKLFAAPNILTAAILYVLYRKELPYVGCRYDGFIDQYQFVFSDKRDQGRALLAQLRDNRENLVPARSFQRALHHLHLDFRKAQRANGNRNGGAL